MLRFQILLFLLFISSSSILNRTSIIYHLYHLSSISSIISIISKPLSIQTDSPTKLHRTQKVCIFPFLSFFLFSSSTQAKLHSISNLFQQPLSSQTSHFSLAVSFPSFSSLSSFFSFLSSSPLFLSSLSLPLPLLPLFSFSSLVAHLSLSLISFSSLVSHLSLVSLSLISHLSHLSLISLSLSSFLSFSSRSSLSRLSIRSRPLVFSPPPPFLCSPIKHNQTFLIISPSLPSCSDQILTNGFALQGAGARLKLSNIAYGAGWGEVGGPSPNGPFLWSEESACPSIKRRVLTYY